MTDPLLIPLAPRPTGKPPRCRCCRRIVNHALTSNRKAIDPICDACAGGGLAGTYRPMPLEWAEGVRWGRLLAERGAACAS